METFSEPARSTKLRRDSVMMVLSSVRPEVSRACMWVRRFWLLTLLV